MLFLRAIPFSFSIMWRYVLVLPMLVVALALFGVVSVIFAMIMGLVSPFLLILMAMAFGVASSVIPIMVGTRVGLQSYRVRPNNSFMGLMMPAIGYGLFEALCLLVLLAVSVGALVLLTPLEATALLTASTSESGDVFAVILAENATIGGIVIAFFLVSMLALRTALLVPFAGASIGADPDGRAHTPFYGFGDGFWSILALALLSFVGTVAAIPLAFLAATPFGFVEAIGVVPEDIGELDFVSLLLSIGLPGYVFIGCAFAFLLYAFSLQCAGAVLVFMRHKTAIKMERREVEAEIEQTLDAPMENTDMMELMRSRMKKRID